MTGERKKSLGLEIVDRYISQGNVKIAGVLIAEETIA